LEGAISGKKAMGRPRLQYLKQVTRNTGAGSYTAMERIACNKSRWKAANQQQQQQQQQRGGGGGDEGGGRRRRRRRRRRNCISLVVFILTLVYHDAWIHERQIGSFLKVCFFL
jgi:hypothetical protein